MSAAEVLPPDEPARERIRRKLDETLFVEAGAGSGKTTALVDRVVELVTVGGVELESIAAITFTEKAGAELRDRLRQRLEERSAEEADRTTVRRCRAALEQLDGAAIGTLHAFAQRILMENPVEAGLPPRVDVLDEVSSDVAFDRRWTSFRDELLEQPVYERPIWLLLATGVKIDALRSLALTFEQNWDLVEERVPVEGEPAPDLCALAKPVFDELREVIALGDHCLDESDKLLARLEKFAAIADGCDAMDEIDLLTVVSQVGKKTGSQWGSFTSSAGRKDNWPGGRKDDILAGLTRVEADFVEIAEQVSQAAIRQIGSALRAFTLRAAEERRRAGELAFHDLLVMARALVRDPQHGSDVRARLHGRYTRLLLDEFQDTDPIQMDIATRIAAAAPREDESGVLPWNEVELAAGHLFVVGDPKQSIYRFRRADISLFLAARSRFADVGGQLDLVTNFRSSTEIIDWVNATFGSLIGPGAVAAEGIASQPAYVGLAPVRPSATVGPPVMVLGVEPHEEGNASALREAEATDVAAAVRQVIGEGWTVDDGDGGWRTASLGDITILLPSRASLPFLEDALGDAGIPFRAEASSLVYSSVAVRDLLMVLRAVDDPTDHLSITAALRTPLFGCGDDDLARFKLERGGRWDFRATQPDTVPADDPVRIGLERMADLAGGRYWSSPSELLERIARDRRAFEIGFAEGRPRDVWRRLRYVIDQARHWSEVTGGGLRQYLQWVDRQTSEGARVAEAVLPETDDDAVRIMTVHAAKGLEFPITIVSGMSTAVRTVPSKAEVAFPPGGGVGYRLGKHVVTDVFEEWKPIDEQMGYHERIRLLYVACTRASDHLIVSLHRLAKETADEDKRTAAELLRAGMGDLLDSLPTVEAGASAPEPLPVVRPPAPEPFEAWDAERRSVLTIASRPSTIAATALTDEGGLDADAEQDVTDGLQKRPQDMDKDPWLKGRYGSAVGRAVHGVLQTVDLATGAGAADAIAAQCQAEAIPDRMADVTKLVDDALGSDIVRAAATSPHWREVYACTPTAGGRLLEGYVDLLYRTGSGLVVVDYKTAATNDPARLDERVAGYRLQGASYAIAVERATTEPVERVVFLFLTPGGAVEMDLEDLAEAKADVEALVAAGGEVVLP